MRVTIDTPRITVFFHKWGTAVERIATLRTEEVTNVPLCAARYNDFAFDRRLTRLTARGEELVKIKVAEEARRFVGSVFMLKALHVRGGGVRWEEGDILTREACAYSFHAFSMFVGGFGIEGYALEVLAALVASEAFRVEAGACCGDNATCNG